MEGPGLARRHTASVDQEHQLARCALHCKRFVNAFDSVENKINQYHKTAHSPANSAMCWGPRDETVRIPLHAPPADARNTCLNACVAMRPVAILTTQSCSLDSRSDKGWRTWRFLRILKVLSWFYKSFFSRDSAHPTHTHTHTHTRDLTSSQHPHRHHN